QALGVGRAGLHTTARQFAGTRVAVSRMLVQPGGRRRLDERNLRQRACFRVREKLIRRNDILWKLSQNRVPVGEVFDVRVLEERLRIGSPGLVRMNVDFPGYSRRL